MGHVSELKRKIKAGLKPESALRASAEKIRRLAKAEAKAAAEWQAEVDQGQPFIPSVSFWESSDAWIEAYDPRILPYAQRAIKAMREARDAFEALDEGTPFDAPLYVQSANTFRVAREAAQKDIFRDPPSRIDFKTPAQLVAEKVPLRQIACEWRLITDDRMPDVERVQRELDQPGSELTEQVIESRRQFHLAQLGFVYEEPDEPDAESTVDRGPEMPPSKAVHHPSIEDLVRSRCPVQQAIGAKAAEYGVDKESYESQDRLRLIEDAVRAVANAMEITLPENSRELVVARELQKA